MRNVASNVQGSGSGEVRAVKMLCKTLLCAALFFFFLFFTVSFYTNGQPWAGVSLLGLCSFIETMTGLTRLLHRPLLW